MESSAQWFSPKDRYGATCTFNPVFFEARCFRAALDKAWPNIPESHPNYWIFVPDHPYNDEMHRVYQADEHGECIRYLVTKEGD